MHFLFIIAVVSYIFLTLWLWRGWLKLAQFTATNTDLQPILVSIVIPMRNEAGHIEQLLDDLSVQKYPTEMYRIFVVDDHSTDDSVSIVMQKANQLNIALLHLPEHQQGKKAALGYSLPYLEGELVATIDADCRLPKTWLSTIAAYYVQHDPTMIICPVMFRYEHTFFSRWQALELISLSGSSAAAVGNGHPIMCSGANLAIRRKTMLQHAHVYDSEFASGDDMMMMLEIKKKKPDAIHYLKSIDATIETTPQPNVRSFIRQRNRWTSKSSKYNDPDVIIVALIVFSANLAIITSLVTGFFFHEYLWLACILLFSKLLVDWPLLRSFTRFWDKKPLMYIFIPTQLLYPFYITWVGIIGNIVPVQWKGRKTNH